MQIPIYLVVPDEVEAVDCLAQVDRYDVVQLPDSRVQRQSLGRGGSIK